MRKKKLDLAEPKTKSIIISDELHYRLRLASVLVNKPIRTITTEALQTWLRRNESKMAANLDSPPTPELIEDAQLPVDEDPML